MKTIRGRLYGLDRQLHMQLVRWHLSRGMTAEVVPREYATRSVPVIQNIENLPYGKGKTFFWTLYEKELHNTLLILYCLWNLIFF